jgi:hypothetical protein
MRALIHPIVERGWMKGMAVWAKEAHAVRVICGFDLRAAVDGEDATWVRYGVDTSTIVREVLTTLENMK